MSFYQKLHDVMRRYEELETQMAACGDFQEGKTAELMQEYSHLTPLAGAIKEYFAMEQESKDLETLIAQEGPSELGVMAQEELYNIHKNLEQKNLEIRTLLLPVDENDKRNVILEIRPGTGGEEAALFVALLLRMYRRYAENKRWHVDIMSLQETEQGGVREVSLAISGRNVYGSLKFEAGVHRVQRVPETEANGRLHTSTATVAVLPEAEEVDILIEEKDLRIDVFRSSGPGGQSVNTTDSAVRITHLPTGVTVVQQDEKSQHKNKAKALKILRARLYEQKMQAQIEERSNNRKEQVGSGERSERIRTYNFPQNRLTDHRIKLTLYKLAAIAEGDLDPVIEALVADCRLSQLSGEEM